MVDSKNIRHLSVPKLHEMECRGSWGMHPAVPAVPAVPSQMT